VPEESACKINATFGFGAFTSEIPLVNTLKKAQSLSAQLGDDESSCNLTLKTGSGVIRVKNQESETEEPEIKEKNKNEKVKPTKPISFQVFEDSYPIPALNVDLNLIFDVVFTEPEAKPEKDKKPQ